MNISRANIAAKNRAIYFTHTRAHNANIFVYFLAISALFVGQKHG
jgi:hypothetical protein